MTIRQLSFATLGTALLTLTGCASHDFDGDPYGKPAEKDEVRYLKINVGNPPDTRAAQFQDGTDEENAISALYFKFYDASGKPIEGDIQSEDIDFVANSAGSNLSVGRIKTMLVKVSIQKGKQLPAYVIAFINPVNYEEINGVENMQDLRNEIRDDYKSNTGDFAMNNAVYYGSDPVSGASQVKMNGTPILANQLYASKDDASDDDALAVDIYVERYAAKVQFTLGESAVEDQTVGDYTLTFKPVAWTVNADAAQMYASKRFNDSNSTTEGIPTYNQVQTMLGGWTTWNDPSLHRSYWACSPSYYATYFPQVSDDIIDLAKEAPVPTTGAGQIIDPYQLRYYSYNQITDQSGTNKSDGKGVTAMNNSGDNWKYVMENTMGAPAFHSANPKAAAPSVVLVGEYDVKVGGTTINPTDGFCIYSGNLFFRNQVPANAPSGAKTIMDALMDLNQVLAVDQDGTLLTSAATTRKNYFEVVHPAKDVRNNQPVPHRYVTLQLKSDLTDAQLAATPIYYKPMGSDAWMPITSANITAINRLLWAQLGNARAYTNNKGYFSIPIQHLGITENTIDPSPISDTGSIDWTKVRVGDFGLVRNHVYSIGVSKIDGIASGIEDLDNPLVPSMEEDTYWVKYRINILNWRVVPAQENIILK